MASSSNTFKSTPTAMNKNAPNKAIANSSVNTSNILLLDNNNKQSYFGLSTSTAASPLKLLHSNDIKLLSDTALLSSIDLFGANNKCESNNSGSGDGFCTNNEKSFQVSVKSLTSPNPNENIFVEPPPPSSSSPPSSPPTNHGTLVKSNSIGKLKSSADTLKTNSELKRMAGTTQAIEAHLDLSSSAANATTTDKDLNEITTNSSSSTMIRDISMANMDDTSGLIITTATPLNLSPISHGVTSSDTLKCSCKSLFSIDNEDNKYDLDMFKSATDMSKNEISVDSSTNKFNANNSKDSKKKVKRSALAWVGRTVGK